MCVYVYVCVCVCAVGGWVWVRVWVCVHACTAGILGRFGSLIVCFHFLRMY